MAAFSAAVVVHAVQPGEVLDLVAQLHGRVEAAFFRHVAEVPPRLFVDRLAAPADLARVQAGHAEDGAHRGGLASAVRTEESEDLAGRDVERQPVERDDRAVPAAQAVNLKLDRSHG